MLSLSRCVIVHDAASCSRESSLSECECVDETPRCLFFTALWLQSSQSVVKEVQSTKDIDLICFKTFPIKAATCLQVGPMSLDWRSDLFTRFDLSYSPLSPRVPSDEHNEAIFLLSHVTVGDRMLFKHHRRFYSVLQVGMVVVPFFPKAYDALLGNAGGSAFTGTSLKRLLCYCDTFGYTSRP